MTSNSKLPGKKNRWVSTALKVNLERTAVEVEIPPAYAPLLQIAGDHYGFHKKTRELLTELNHPYINWDFVLDELKSISIGNFYIYNKHPEGLTAISILLTIYFDILKSAATEDVKDSAIHYLFDYADAIITQSNEFLERNLSVLPGLVDDFLELARDESPVFKKCSAYLKRIIRSVTDKGLQITGPGFGILIFKMFRATYSFWLSQPDPAVWQVADHRPDATPDDSIYQGLVKQLGHQHFHELMRSLEELQSTGSPQSGSAFGAYLDLPDFFQILDGYLVVADELEKAEAYRGHHLVKLDFLIYMMSVPGLRDIHVRAMREINHALKLVFGGKEGPE